jgi:hypothetical protein
MKYFLILILTLMLLSCRHNKLDVDISKIDVTINVNRLEKLLFVDDTATFSKNLGIIMSKHSGFFDIYTKHVLKIGSCESSDFRNNLNLFVFDSVISRVADSVQYVFNDFHRIECQLSDGFRHYKYYFPNAIIPEVFTCVTGFNQSVFTCESGIGIGLDKYLGADCIFYSYLGMPQYKSANMHRGKIATDLFYSIFITEFPYHDSINNLLSNMIYQGKALYFTKAMCPTLPDSIIMGFSSKQLKWCNENEVQMWSFLIERKLLYDFERLTLQKFVGDAPFTNSFSKDSPGRTGSWLGLKIVESFMNKNPEVSLKELAMLNNAQTILSRSGYFPE